MDGDYQYDARRNSLTWSVDLIDSSNRSGALEFVVPVASSDAFFPVDVVFSAQHTLCQVAFPSVLPWSGMRLHTLGLIHPGGRWAVACPLPLCTPRISAHLERAHHGHAPQPTLHHLGVPAFFQCHWALMGQILGCNADLTACRPIPCIAVLRPACCWINVCLSRSGVRPLVSEPESGTMLLCRPFMPATNLNRKPILCGIK